MKSADQLPQLENVSKLLRSPLTAGLAPFLKDEKLILQLNYVKEGELNGLKTILKDGCLLVEMSVEAPINEQIFILFSVDSAHYLGSIISNINNGQPVPTGYFKPVATSIRECLFRHWRTSKNNGLIMRSENVSYITVGQFFDCDEKLLIWGTLNLAHSLKDLGQNNFAILFPRNLYNYFNN